MVKQRMVVAHDLRRMQIPEDYWAYTVASLPESARAGATKYLARLPSNVRSGVSLLVTGDVGAGKTTLSTLVLKQARSLGYSGFFCTVWDFRESLRNRIIWEEDLLVADRVRDVDVLALDGLRDTDRDEYGVNAEFLADLLGYRAGKRKVTVLTTSLVAADLRDKFPGMTEVVLGHYAHIHVTGPNHRKVKAAVLRKVVGLWTRVSYFSARCSRMGMSRTPT